LTSLIRTSRGLMTVQTELSGDPLELVTIVDFRGRVLKRWTRPFALDVDDAGAELRRWHATIEGQVRDSLSHAARARARPPQLDKATSRLFLAGITAYAKHDFDAARIALRACARLLPEDLRVRAALARLDG
jgi:hypothetical protein